MLLDKLPIAAVEEYLDGSTLGFKPEPALALAFRGNAQVGNEFTVMPYHCLGAAIGAVLHRSSYDPGS